jgi:hypothetical protein
VPVVHLIDTWTGVSGTNVAVHVPDQSTQVDQWFVDDPDLLLDGAGGIYAVGGSPAMCWLYYWLGTTAAVDQQFRLVLYTLAGQAGVVGRAAAAHRAYGLVYDAATAKFILYKRIDGSTAPVVTPTLAATVTLAAGVNGPYTARWRNSGGDVRVTVTDVGGTVVFDATDAAAAPVGGVAPYTAATAQWGVAGAGSLTATTGVHLGRIEFLDGAAGHACASLPGTIGSGSAIRG